MNIKALKPRPLVFATVYRQACFVFWPGLLSHVYATSISEISILFVNSFYRLTYSFIFFIHVFLHTWIIRAREPIHGLPFFIRFRFRDKFAKSGRYKRSQSDFLIQYVTKPFVIETGVKYFWRALYAIFFWRIFSSSSLMNFSMSQDEQQTMKER